jgi:hypothetical protein
MRKKLMLLSVLLSLSFWVYAQEAEKRASKFSYGKAGLDYLSDNVFMGRRDSVAIPYITFNLGYHHKSGFFAEGYISYLPANGENRVDVYVLEGGYEFEVGDKFSASFSASKSFFNDGSYAVKSDINASLAGYMEYNTNPVSLYSGLFYNIGNNADFALALGASHHFFLMDDKLDIAPGVSLNASTRQFYKSYVTLRRQNTRRLNGGTLATVTIPAAVDAEVKKFKILDYEFSAPIVYTTQKNFSFTFTPTYAIPVNPLSFPRFPRFTEKLSNSFFFELGVGYRF